MRSGFKPIRSYKSCLSLEKSWRSAKFFMIKSQSQAPNSELGFSENVLSDTVKNKKVKIENVSKFRFSIFFGFYLVKKKKARTFFLLDQMMISACLYSSSVSAIRFLGYELSPCPPMGFTFSCGETGLSRLTHTLNDF